MKEYLKMADVFDCELLMDCDCDDAIVDEQSFVVLESFDGSDVAKYAAHAINSHDDLVAEVERLRGALHDAATSLETIHIRSFGEESLLDSKPQMRSFAGARAKVAREALAE